MIKWVITVLEVNYDVFTLRNFFLSHTAYTYKHSGYCIIMSANISP